MFNFILNLFLADAAGSEEIVEETTKINFAELLNQIVTWLTTEGLKLVLGLIVLLIVFKIINCISRRVKKRMEKKWRWPKFNQNY